MRREKSIANEKVANGWGDLNVGIGCSNDQGLAHKKGNPRHEVLSGCNWDKCQQCGIKQNGQRSHSSLALFACRKYDRFDLSLVLVEETLWPIANCAVFVNSHIPIGCEASGLLNEIELEQLRDRRSLG